MARRKTKTNVKKATTNVSTTAVSEMSNDNNSIANIKDDPGGTEDENHFHNKNITNRTNGINVNFVKAIKDQTSSVTSSLSSSAVSVVTSTNATSTISNDSKYLHKKFKKFCATVDSNQVTNHHNNYSHNNSDISKLVSTTSIPSTINTSITATAVVSAGLLNNNNSEIVENKNNSWTPSSVIETSRSFQQLNVPLQTPKHLLTTEEEKQLVKDIIDINNENFMHHSANNNFTSSSFLITQNLASGVGGLSTGTVTTLGNHNSNFQTNNNDIRQQKVASSTQDSSTTFNPTSNSNFVIINNHQVDYSPASSIHPTTITSSPSSTVPISSSATITSTTNTGGSLSTPGRYICPYCQLNCAKPSVLQKHIRAHTNERPYPCTPCGFAFKTKSNLYKHCRSRAHIQRCSGETDPNLLAPSNEEDGCSLESGDIDESEVLSQNENMNNQRLSSPSIVMDNQMNGNFGENSSSSSSNSSAAYPINSSSDTSSIVTKPYKPKFHNYKKLDLSKANAIQSSSNVAISTPSTPLTPSFFNGKSGNLTPQIIEEHISRIISDNEAIIDNVEALLQKKYHKITGIQRNLSTSSTVISTTTSTMTNVDQQNSLIHQQQQQQLQQQPPPQSNSKLALALLKQQQQQKQHDEEIMRYQMATQPLNLIKIQEPLSVDVGTSVINVIPRKKFLNENPSPLVIASSQIPTESVNIIPPSQHLPVQQQQQQQQQQLIITEKPSQLVIPVSHPQNPEGSIIKDLLLNSKNFGAIDGEAGDGTYTCPTCKISFRGADILKYHLICHCGDETIISRSAPISPTSSSTSNNATSPYYRSGGSEKYSPSSLSNIAQSQLRAAISPRTPSSLQKLAKSQLKVPKQKPENIIISPAISAIKIVAGHQAIVKNPLPSPGPLLGNTRLVDSKEEFNSMKKQKLDYNNLSASNSSGGSDKKISPFFDMKFMHDRSTPSKNFPSGGGFTALENCNEMQTEEMSPNLMRQGLSGGIALEVPVKKETNYEPPPITPKLIVTITPTLAPTLTTNTNALFTASSNKNHFQFPPTVTVYNPLTLPLLNTQQAGGTQSIVHGGRVIPYVPGIPGPNTGMTIVNKNDLPPPPVPIKDKRLNSPSMKQHQQNGIVASPSAVMPRPNGVIAKKKSFNFARIADNIDGNRSRKSPETSEIVDEDVKPSKPAFLRPTTLSLKPGTFTPKQHHGITPTANTLPLISPETPRPSKSCVQLYLNGHAYTYLGLKSSTKPFYCTVNKPQPSYIQNQHKLSMYSNWQIYNGNNPNILDLSPYAAMSLYDSRQRPSKFSIADEKKELVSLVEMQTIKITSCVTPTIFPNQIQQVTVKDEQLPNNNSNNINNNNNSAVAAYENNDEYTYIRGRGRGKYICQECGIRCKKPSMLKKHIRTHTDLRPYTCSYCDFSFKTKGNLTKHMKSKAHFKKCTELGISPIPTMPDDDVNDPDEMSEKNRRIIMNGGEDMQRDDSETEDNESDDEGEDDSGDEDTDESKSRMPEHEAAQLLLSLSNHAGTRPSSENSNPPQIIQQQIQIPQQMENWQEPVAATAALTPRSRIVFSNSKPNEFDFHEMGKYYSDPSLSRPKELSQPSSIRDLSNERMDEEEDSMPIDLTKKSHSKPTVEQHHHHQQPVIVRVSEVITKISDPAVLLNQLVSNTDKHQQQVQGLGRNFTDAIQYSESYLPQEYHMERALKNARFKQIQHAGKTIDYERLQTTPVKDQQPTHHHQQTSSPIINTTATTTASVVNSNKNGMMEALAELAAKSDKLEIKNQIDDSSKVSSTNFNAKSVATEYLKLTQQKLIQRSTQEEQVDGGSDQEAQEPSSSILLAPPQTVVVGEDGFHKKSSSMSNAIFNNDPLLYSQLQDDSGRPVCVVCRKTFQKASQLKIHMNIHYMERKYRCEACSVSFRTQGHLQKHERSTSHQNKVNMTSTFGVPTVSNPRPFKCKDCKIAFRIHGHLAKHLRSKMHVLKLECLQKLPFGTYAEMERAGFNLTDIDTSDCDNSLMSLRSLAKKLNEKDPSKLGPLPPLSNENDDCDESGMNENYDSDSDGQIDDMQQVLLKRKSDESDFDNLKRIKLVASENQQANDTHVPSSNVNFSSKDGGEKMACAKN